MSTGFNGSRRKVLHAAAAGSAAAELGFAQAGPAKANIAATLQPLRRVKAGVLEICYYEAGPAHGPAVLLLHGFPYDIHSYIEVAPILAERGCRVIVPYLRGYGPTRFLSADTPRAGQQAAIGADALALLDALRIEHAVLAGYDWGGRAACVVAALWPQRCAGLLSVNSYLIQDIARAGNPLPPKVEAGFWYQYYFLTERGRTGLAQHRRDLARLLWQQFSPAWRFDDAIFERSAPAFDNPDFVDIVIHSYRHRMGAAAGAPDYAELEQRLAALPVISVPTITMDGEADGVVAASNGTASAKRFSGPRSHRQIPGVGHNPPAESPALFASAVMELV